MRLFQKIIFLLFLFLYPFTFSSFVSAKTTMLMLSPVRLIFTDKDRAIQARVMNRGDETVNYTISIETRRKGADGKSYISSEETSREKMIKKMIRFSPRRATIKPGERQVVKLITRKPKDLPKGEYRLSLVLNPLSPAKSSSNQTVTNTLNQKTFNLDLLVRTAVPVIIQHGGITADVTPEGVSLKDFSQSSSGIGVEVTLERAGDASSFGNIYVYHLPNGEGGTEKKIGHTQGAAIYLPHTSRSFIVPLKDITREELTSGALKISYSPSLGRNDTRSKDYRGHVTSSKVFSLPL